MKLKNELENETSMGDTEEEQRQHEALKAELMEKLDYISMLYQRQYDGIDKRIKKYKSDMYNAVLLFVIVATVDGILSAMLASPGGGILGMSIEIWVAAISLFIALIKTGKGMISAIFTYNVQIEKKSLLQYIRKYDIFTIEEERRYCCRKLDEVTDLKKKLKDLEQGMKYTEYADYEYIEKRADADVLDGFYKLPLW